MGSKMHVHKHAVFQVCNLDNLLCRDSLCNLHINEETWADIKCYKNEYKLVITEKERNRIPFLHRSPQSYYRYRLVVYMKEFASKRKLSHCTIHLAVYLLDIFMDNHAIKPKQLGLIANVCLRLAAKVEEKIASIPSIYDLNNAVNNFYEFSAYLKLEIVVLKFFKWYIMFPTTAHYAYYYMQVALCREDIEFKNLSPKRLSQELHAHTIVYLDKIMEDVHYMQYHTPSKLASAIISIARENIGLIPWTRQLYALTDYTEIHIAEARNALLRPLPLLCKCPLISVGINTYLK